MDEVTNNKRMRVLVGAFACDPTANSGLGSGEDVLGWNIIRQICKFADVWVIASDKNKEGIAKFLGVKKMQGLNVTYVSLPKLLSKPLWHFWSKGASQIYSYLWQMKVYGVARKLHREIHFDVFHHVTYANDWMASFIGAFLPVAYIRGPGGGAQKIPANFVKKFPFKNRAGERIRSIGQWIFRHDPWFIIGQNRAQALLVCNKESFEGLPKKWQKKAYFFPVNGISNEDLENVNRQEASQKSFSVVTAGRLFKLKGFDLAIRAFKIFSDTVGAAQLTIIGDGPELRNLETLIQKLNLGGKVTIVPWMPRKEFLRTMGSCKVFLFASLRDGGGAVVVEAMALGKPVICFDLAGPGFHINDKCGIKIQPGNPEQAVYDMAKALEKLYTDNGLRLALGNGARKEAEKEYRWDALGDRLFDIYHAALHYGTE